MRSPRNLLHKFLRSVSAFPLATCVLLLRGRWLARAGTHCRGGARPVSFGDRIFDFGLENTLLSHLLLVGFLRELLRPQDRPPIIGSCCSCCAFRFPPSIGSTMRCCLSSLWHSICGMTFRTLSWRTLALGINRLCRLGALLSGLLRLPDSQHGVCEASHGHFAVGSDQQGLTYIGVSAQFDPVASLVMVAALAPSIALPRLLMPFALGILL